MLKFYEAGHVFEPKRVQSYWNSLSQEQRDEIIKDGREKAIADAKFKRFLSECLGLAAESYLPYRI